MATKYPRPGALRRQPITAGKDAGRFTNFLEEYIQSTCSAVNGGINATRAITDNRSALLLFTHIPRYWLRVKMVPVMRRFTLHRTTFSGHIFCVSMVRQRIGHSITPRFNIITLDRKQSSRTNFIIVRSSSCARNSIGDRLTVSLGSAEFDRCMTAMASAAPCSRLSMCALESQAICIRLGDGATHVLPQNIPIRDVNGVSVRTLCHMWIASVSQNCNKHRPRPYSVRALIGNMHALDASKRRYYVIKETQKRNRMRHVN